MGGTIGSSLDMTRTMAPPCDGFRNCQGRQIILTERINRTRLNNAAWVAIYMLPREAENGVGMNRSARGGKCKAL